MLLNDLVRLPAPVGFCKHEIPLYFLKNDQSKSAPPGDRAFLACRERF
jgi:hypothetical protein